MHCIISRFAEKIVLKNTVEYLQKSGLQVVACTEKGKDLIYDTPMAQPLAIILGSEEDGISNDLIRTADFLAKIPTTGKNCFIECIGFWSYCYF